MGIAAPVIVTEMAEWVALGGGNSGIVGDPNHTYGFHLAANEVPASDYSRWRDPNGSDGPYVDWRYCCAGDFRHSANIALRAKHRDVLARLMRGELPMICEFIGQPYSDQPVYYWARWNGITNLQRYTGAGHDLWSHISWYRSMVDQRAHLWTKEDDMAWLTDERAEAQWWRIEALLHNRPAVAGGALAGEVNQLHNALKALSAKVLTEAQVRKIVAEELAKDPTLTPADLAQVTAAAQAGAAAGIDGATIRK